MQSFIILLVSVCISLCISAQVVDTNSTAETNSSKTTKKKIDKVKLKKNNKTKSKKPKKRKKRKKRKNPKLNQKKLKEEFKIEKWAENSKIDSSVVTEASNILEELYNSNPNSDRYLGVILGAVQIVTNTEGLDDTGSSAFPIYGIDFNYRIYDELYIEAKYFKASNDFNTDDSVLNGPKASQTTYDVGFKYRIILDKTKPSNYLGFKLLSHNTVNNFKTSATNTLIINRYKGIGVGVEKGIPITKSLGMDASFDIINISQAATDQATDLGFEDNGLGFTVRGEFYLKLTEFMRASVSYTQNGMLNKLESTGISATSKTYQSQTYRLVGGAFAYSF
ncbi:MAG: hypothetical protein AB8E15_01630 [Bdellovibrionales bacterium]